MLRCEPCAQNTFPRPPQNPDAPCPPKKKGQQSFFSSGEVCAPRYHPRHRLVAAREASFPSCMMPRMQPERSQNAGTWNVCSAATKYPTAKGAAGQFLPQVGLKHGPLTGSVFCCIFLNNCHSHFFLKCQTSCLLSVACWQLQF